MPVTISGCGHHSVLLVAIVAAAIVVRLLMVLMVVVVVLLCHCTVVLLPLFVDVILWKREKER